MLAKPSMKLKRTTLQLKKRCWPWCLLVKNLGLTNWGAHGEPTHHRGLFRRKPSCGFGFVMYYMY